MVRYLTMAGAMLGMLLLADFAQARGRHGCASCGVAVSSCPGGVCGVSMGAPGKMAVVDGAAPAYASQPAVAQPVAVPAAVVSAPSPAPRYYANTGARRGLFGWRR